MLKNIIITITLIILTAFSDKVFSYEIELKSGTIIRTEDFWEEDGKIFYYKHGIVVSIQKSKIKEIIGVDEEPKEISMNNLNERFADDPKVKELDEKIVELDLTIKEWQFEKGQLEWDRKRYENEMTGEQYIQNRNKRAQLDRQIRDSLRKLKQLTRMRENLITQLEMKENQEFVKKMSE